MRQTRYSLSLTIISLLVCASLAMAQITPAPQGHILQDDGTTLRQQPYLNFAGPGMTCVDDPTSRRTTCTIAGAALPASFAVGDLLYADTTTTLAKRAAVATGSLFASAGVNTAPVWSASPTLTTSLTVPVIIGGTAADTALVLKSTSGVGTTDAISFKVGNNGAIEGLRVNTSGFVGVQTGLPVTRFQVNGGPVVFDTSASWATTKFDSQGVAWSSRTGNASLLFNESASVRPEINFTRGSRTYPELAIRQHTTSDTGGEIYAGPGTGAPTKIADLKATGIDVTGALSATKGLTPRVVTVADATSITCNWDTMDICGQLNTQAIGTLTMNNFSGTCTDGQRMTLRIKSTNVQTYSWGAAFRGSVDAALPTVTTGTSKTDYLGVICHTGDAKIDMLAQNKGF